MKFIHNKKSIFSFVTTPLLLIAILISYQFFWPSNTNTSSLVREISVYEEEHQKTLNLDVTFLAQKYIKQGMTIPQTVHIFEKMGFDVHQNWHDNNIYIADFRSNIGPKFFHIVKTYRFRLHFSEGSLSSFEGFIFSQSP